jgi:hypothetical protein
MRDILLLAAACIIMSQVVEIEHLKKENRAHEQRMEKLLQWMVDMDLLAPAEEVFDADTNKSA